MAWKANPDQHRSSQLTLAAILLGVLSVVFGVVLLVREYVLDDTAEQEQVVEVASEAPDQEETATEEAPTETVVEPDAPTFNTAAIQSAVDTWAAGQSGQASVVIRDPVSSTVLASHNPDTVYFAASIYKLYVAYEGYRQIDAGVLDGEVQYLGGNTLSQCLDLMIRDSDSPCAEKLWVELGKETLNTQLVEYGLTDTDMVAITTTAADAARALEWIATRQFLSQTSQLAFDESMREQIFRDTLNVGFSDDVVVYNKIGFRELDEYHDVAFIELPSGDRVVVSVMTSGVGTSQIAQLGRDLEAVLLAQD